MLSAKNQDLFSKPLLPEGEKEPCPHITKPRRQQNNPSSGVQALGSSPTPASLHTSVSVYASSAVHSAFAVGLLSAKMMGRSLMEAMALSTSSENRRPAPATPGGDGNTQKPALTAASGQATATLPPRAKLLWTWEPAAAPGWLTLTIFTSLSTECAPETYFTLFFGTDVYKERGPA